MTYEEAKAIIERLQDVCAADLYEALDLALTCISMQIPEKPIPGPFISSMVCSCPECGSGVVDKWVEHIKGQWCDSCGQRLDWRR